MSVWDRYESRITATGATQRERTKTQEFYYLNYNLPKSLSYHEAIVDGEDRKLAIINSDNLNEKMLYTLPGEDIDCGALVEWMENHWLITEKDANNEVYTRAKMLQCNYLLRWIDDGEIIERWSIIADGTKYLTGEYGDNGFVFLRGDSRISMTITKDEHTAKLNRESRFLVDDYDTGTVMAYRLTKPFKLGGTFNDKGVYIFVLSECTTEDDDNLELHIPDYYKYFPRDGDQVVVAPGDGTTATGKKVWL